MSQTVLSPAADDAPHRRLQEARHSARWQLALALLVTLGISLTLPERLTPGPAWLVPSIEIGILIPLLIAAAIRTNRAQYWQRTMAIALIAVLNAANLVSLLLLVDALLHDRLHLAVIFSGAAQAAKALPPEQLIFEAMKIWLTNVVVFGLWYWEIDRGGPVKRFLDPTASPDFLFPNMTVPEIAGREWMPKLIDYIYLSFTNATAFSPTDTLPLTSQAKLLMMVQSLGSLLTVALVAARAVNILN